MMLNREQLIVKRDKKVQGVFLEFAPIWLLNDEYRPKKDSFFFNLVYCHPVHSWLNEHYQYDGFNDVLYHMGQHRVAEQPLLEIQEQIPYISGNGTASIPNHPAGRL